LANIEAKRKATNGMCTSICRLDTSAQASAYLRLQDRGFAFESCNASGIERDLLLANVEMRPRPERAILHRDSANQCFLDY
jgi:hypothetical protein